MGTLQARFVWLRTHTTDHDAGNAANEIAAWLYEHRSRFPDDVANHLVKISVTVYDLCNPLAAQNAQHFARLLALIDRDNTAAWDAIKAYKEKLESELFEK